MKAILATILSIPLSSPVGWESLNFDKIPANKIEHTTEGLLVTVNKSAGPLIYSLKKTSNILKVEVSGQVQEGGVKLNLPKKQGLKKYDDFPFRLGLVLEGKQTLNWFQRKMAPQWVLKMHSLAPKGKGVDRIHFLEVSNSKELIGTKRDHYLSKYLTEQIVASLKPDGSFVFSTGFNTPLKVIGLWISIDGDDTASKYKVLIKNLTLYQR